MNIQTVTDDGERDVPKSPHTFHIPVMGTAFSIDTALRIAKYGISTVLSLVDDVLIEQVRRHHSLEWGEPCEEIGRHVPDSRALRITAYLDLLDRLVGRQSAELRAAPFEPGSEITRYFELLPPTALKKLYRRMISLPDGDEKLGLQEELRRRAVPGGIDVNIMTKVDRMPPSEGDPLPPESSEALAALRGFARSTLRSSIILSAGLNPRLYSYIATFDDFFPNPAGELAKRVVLKVSDYRSAVIQGKFLAKKGLWVSEFRVESGLNCGGHAFATNGFLTGPILEEFRDNRSRLLELLHGMYRKALAQKGRTVPREAPEMKITVQGGIGTAQENSFLLTYYNVDATGWGTPFLLCPEAANVDDDHLRKLVHLEKGDVYLSGSSPLGLPFWNLRTSASEERRRARIAEGRPGSSCPKGHLKFNTDFTEKPVCLASRAYQKKRLASLKEGPSGDERRRRAEEETLEKSCICNDLAGGATLKYGIDPKAAPAICPGPNIVNFTRIVSLEEMVGHIYGRISLLTNPDRPHMFVRELMLYIDYLRGEVENCSLNISVRQPKQLVEFKENLLQGIDYYRKLAGQFIEEQRERFKADLAALQRELEAIIPPAAKS